MNNSLSSQNANQQDKKVYTVHVDSNFQSGDNIYIAGKYDTYEEALEKCKEIVEEDVADYGDSWISHGEAPFIVCEGGTLEDWQIFSAKKYYEETYNK